MTKIDKLTKQDRERIIKALVNAGNPEPTQISCIEDILRYVPNCHERDAMIGTKVLEEAGLNVAYDGDPKTTECGIDFDTVPHSVVIMVKENIFID